MPKGRRKGYSANPNEQVRKCSTCGEVKPLTTDYFYAADNWFRQECIAKGSAESKDGDEEMQRLLRRIEQRLDRIESATGVRQGERPLTEFAQTGGGQDTSQTEQLVYRSDWAQGGGAQADGARERSHNR